MKMEVKFKEVSVGEDFKLKDEGLSLRSGRKIERKGVFVSIGYGSNIERIVEVNAIILGGNALVGDDVVVIIERPPLPIKLFAL